MDEILDSRIFGRWKKLQYLVKWTGESPTWDSAAGVDGLQAIDRSHALHPLKLGPLPLDLDFLSFAGAQRLGGGTVTAPAPTLAGPGTSTG